jgi:uncharacterized protein
MHSLIQKHLQIFAAEHGIRILFACETGSRGWGFASPDSDFDIRFVFVHPKEKYLSLQAPLEQVSTIFEDGGEVLDFNAWELRKFLRLFGQSNATPFEWLQSPIIYGEEAGFKAGLWPFADRYFSPRAGIHHYLGICKSSMKAGIEGDTINIKKYFYILRPLLAASWAADKGTVPPMEFAPLLAQIESNRPVWDAVQLLLKQKEQTNEGERIPLVPVLQTFIDSEMARCLQASENYEKVHTDIGQLDPFFQQWL